MVELKQPYLDGVLNPKRWCSVLFMCCWQGTRAGCFVPCFSPAVKQSTTDAKGSLRAQQAWLFLCSVLGLELGQEHFFFCIVSAGAEFAPFFPELEVKDRLAGFSGQESTLKIMMLVLFLVWISAVLCVLSALFWWGFCYFYPKRGESRLILLKDV